MRVKLLNLELSGIKNISEKINFSFSKSKIDGDFDFSNYNVKSIYGKNGAGKSAIIDAVEIYRRILSDNNFLSDNAFIKKLESLISYKTNTFETSVTFALDFYETNDFAVYNHFLKIALIDGEYEIVEEALTRNRSENIFEIEGTIYAVKYGVLTKVYDKSADSSFKEKLIDQSKNLLSKNSLAVIINKQKINVSNEEDIDMIVDYLSPLFFVGYVRVIDEDGFSNDFGEFKKIELRHIIELAKTGEPFYKNTSFIESKNGQYFVRKNSIEQFEIWTEKLCEFIKMFIPELVSVDVEKKENAYLYVCDLIFNYDKFKVAIQFESKGIKKLVKMYNDFCLLDIGRILFIDEFDANLHDVYLSELISYVAKYSKGQLIFTTHNLAPMMVLDELDKNNYIDFISNNTVVSWDKKEKNKPHELYKLGFILHNAFNIKDHMFLGLFSGDEDE